MKNKHQIGAVVFIAHRGFVLQTTIESVQSDPKGECCAYSYAGRLLKDGTADPYVWESDVFTTFDGAAKRAIEQRQ